MIADGSSNEPFLKLYEQGIQPCHITPPADSITQTTKKKNQFLALVADYKAFKKPFFPTGRSRISVLAQGGHSGLRISLTKREISHWNNAATQRGFQQLR